MTTYNWHQSVTNPNAWSFYIKIPTGAQKPWIRLHNCEEGLWQGSYTDPRYGSLNNMTTPAVPDPDTALAMLEYMALKAKDDAGVNLCASARDRVKEVQP